MVVNAGTLKPVGWESSVHDLKTNKAAVYKTRRIMLRAGATGEVGGAAGGKARSTEAKTNTRGSNLSAKFCTNPSAKCRIFVGSAVPGKR
jgi:hypothetical protein